MESIEQREALERAAVARGESLAALSRLIGRNAAYLQQFVTRGSPRLLAEADRRKLARYLGLSDAALGGPAVEGLVPVARVDAGAAAGRGRLVETERRSELLLDPALLRRLGVRADMASTIRVEGASMEPNLCDGRRDPGRWRAARAGRAPGDLRVPARGTGIGQAAARDGTGGRGGERQSRLRARSGAAALDRCRRAGGVASPGADLGGIRALPRFSFRLRLWYFNAMHRARVSLASIVAAALLTMPAAASAQRAGTLVSADPVGSAPDGMRAWRVRYRTLSDRNQPIEVSGMVIAPARPAGGPAR
ncbi:hypothetical protein DdX_20963 [Ditylenchus destructor]|uniref:Uncharacterized protein n=1 Tax=Ditylenchus destructor TaxID=166010 RepID=A0AAD4MKE1_9BILA|nr:hypothetical protein DdX_20963 [Ditylenchus destructor]